MAQLNLLIKPASGHCNMDCSYCFYHDVLEHRELKNSDFMSNDTLEILVKRAFENPFFQQVNFMFQGGEPTLVGLEFYETLIRYVRQYNIHNINVHYSIQTNGTLLTDDFVDFFKQHDFLVGISIDGPEDVHNENRMISSHDSFDKVLEGLKLLLVKEVPHNILFVVTGFTSKHAKETYRYLSNLGTEYLQFIPCISSFEEKNERYISVSEYETFLKIVFDEWAQDFHNGRRISIRYFDDILKILLGYGAESCTLFGHCVPQPVIESDGNVYPCDFYVLDEWKLGNVHTESFLDLMQNEHARCFVQSSVGVHPDCKICEYFSLCRGGCKRNKEPFTTSFENKTIFCQAYKNFFQYALNRFIEIAKILKSEMGNTIDR